MESITETLWDVVIYGTGLQESFLALSLSRSGKKVLHLDPNDYYGGPDASLSLQEAEGWTEKHSSLEPNPSFGSASVTKSPETSGLSFSRAYSLALSPQIIHGRSTLLSQLVSSRAYRQLEFLAVGSFFVFKTSSKPSQAPSLTRIPSTREDVFSATAIPARSKRSLMKFLKFVLDYEGTQQRETWQPFAEKPLAELLRSQFGLDAELQMFVHTLTLSLCKSITAKEGLAIIHKHLTSMGMFGPGFAAVYPKWGGISEIAQVACRAGAVGGAVYKLGTRLNEVHHTQGSDKLQLDLSTEPEGDVRVETQLLVKGSEHTDGGKNSKRTSRLVVVVDSSLRSLFEPLVEGAPAPAVAVIAFLAGSSDPEHTLDSPIYAFTHSSETGECPTGQSVLYFTTLTENTTEQARARLEAAVSSFLAAVDETKKPQCLYRFYYEYLSGSGGIGNESDGKVLTLPGSAPGLAFDDSTLEPVHEAWKVVMGSAADDPETEYMIFPDREGAEECDDDYE